MSNYKSYYHQTSSLRNKRAGKQGSNLFVWIGFIIFCFFIIKACGGGKTNNEDLTLTIPEGASISYVSDELEELGVINSSFLFSRQVEKSEKPILAGTFTIPANTNTTDLINIITNTPESIKFTIIEGQTITEIDNKLTEAGLISAGEFIECTQNCNLSESFPYKEFFNQNPRNLEGFLFPDTYFLYQNNFNTEEFLNDLLSHFTEKYQSIAELNQTKYNPYQIITMASILEKEVRTKKDLSIVSGILWKRLENNWLIGADATLLYQKNNREITYQDLQDDNPYNTRKNLGLPPTPINNPGLEMIKAAMQPQDSEYWFYLTTLDTGEVIYARTNEEHNLNKEKYLR